MNDLKVFRWTGAFGVAAFVLVLVEFPLYVSRGPTPLLEDTTRYADFMSRNSGNVLTCVVLDMLIFVGILVFLAGFRHLIRQARPDYEWLATKAGPNGGSQRSGRPSPEKRDSRNVAKHQLLTCTCNTQSNSGGCPY